jgi:hypothetical protein
MNYRKAALFPVAILFLAIPLVADHDGRHNRPERDFQANLRGRNEVPLTLSAGRGTLSLTVNDMDTGSFLLSIWVC